MKFASPACLEPAIGRTPAPKLRDLDRMTLGLAGLEPRAFCGDPAKWLSTRRRPPSFAVSAAQPKGSCWSRM